MKKIAIITLYDEINIGNKLQNYAVQCFFENLGFECETIRHWEMANSKIGFKSLKLNIIKIIGHPKASSAKLRLGEQRKKRFESFSRTYLKTGPIVKIQHLPENLFAQYDYFVAGSDQVWHNWTGDKAEMDYFFLQFAKKFQRLTIAPSFGRNFIEQISREAYVKGLNGIPVITCREQQGAELIHKLTGRDAEVILDPTMLIEEKIWDKIEKKPEIEPSGKYILVYVLGMVGTDMKHYIENIAKEKGLLIIDIYNIRMPDLYMTTPDEFIYYIRHAELIVTDSFHASVFSILFKKNFIVFDRKTKSMGDMTSRLDTLLQLFNLSDRRYPDCDKDKIFCADFSKVDAILREERMRTKKLYRKTFEVLERLRLVEEEGCL